MGNPGQGRQNDGDEIEKAREGDGDDDDDDDDDDKYRNDDQDAKDEDDSYSNVYLRDPNQHLSKRHPSPKTKASPNIISLRLCSELFGRQIQIKRRSAPADT